MKKASTTLDASHHKITFAFPQNDHCSSLCSGSALCVFSISSYRVLSYVLCSKFDKIIFTASSRTFLSETDICFFTMKTKLRKREELMRKYK